jgi:2,3-bisphosphoglycerate-independent phosphoglycerate mutase
MTGETGRPVGTIQDGDTVFFFNFRAERAREITRAFIEPDFMSAPAVTLEIINRINSGRYGFMVLNYANLDMVGHTGILDAIIKACEVVDTCLGQVISAVSDQGGIVILTADHGNAEEMIDRKLGGPHTAHTSTNPVPVLLIDPERPKVRLKNGILADMAPTILTLLNIPIPEEMNGECLQE